MLKAKTLIWLFVILFNVSAAPSGLAEEQVCGEKTYIEVNDDNYKSEVLESTQALIVFFYAAWCPYSDSLLPIYKQIENSYSRQVKFCRFLLGDEYKDFSSPEGKALWARLKENYGVNMLPTLAMFNEGKELDRMRGRPEKELVSGYAEFLKKWIDSNLIDPQENPYLFESTLMLRKK
ncbi:thioredoxin family protein [Candidatus Omnitrophota bacterium]